MARLAVVAVAVALVVAAMATTTVTAAAAAAGAGGWELAATSNKTSSILLGRGDLRRQLQGCLPSSHSCGDCGGCCDGA